MFEYNKPIEGSLALVLDIIYWLIPLTLFLLAIVIWVFFWAVRNGQYSDLDSPAVSILMDDDAPNNTDAAIKRTSPLPKSNSRDQIPEIKQ